MEVVQLMQEIERLALDKKFFIIEETLKYIKMDESNHLKATDFKDISYLISEQSLAKDWLSEEDNRWDLVL
jgi:hypothetical protein